MKRELQQLKAMVLRLEGEIASIEEAQKLPELPAPKPQARSPVPPPQLPLTYIGRETRTRRTDEDFSFERRELITRSWTRP